MRFEEMRSKSDTINITEADPSILYNHFHLALRLVFDDLYILIFHQYSKRIGLVILHFHIRSHFRIYCNNVRVGECQTRPENLLLISMGEPCKLPWVGGVLGAREASTRCSVNEAERPTGSLTSELVNIASGGLVSDAARGLGNWSWMPRV